MRQRRNGLMAELTDAAHRWSVLTICRRFLQEARQIYEKERKQPVVGRSPGQHETPRVLGITCFSRSEKQRLQRLGLWKLRSSFSSFATLKCGQRCSAPQHTLPCMFGQRAGWPQQRSIRLQRHTQTPRWWRVAVVIRMG